MRPGATPSASSDASRPQAPPVILVPGPRVAASEPSRVISEADVMSLGRSNLSDDSSGGSSSFVRSRHAEEAAARARSLRNESQLNLRSSPWQDAGSEHSGSTATAGARRPSANVMGDVSSARALQHAPAASASDSLAVFEKPLLAALSGDEITGMHAAEVVRTVCFLLRIVSCVTLFCRTRATPTQRGQAITSVLVVLRASIARVFQRTRSTALSESGHPPRTQNKVNI